MWRLPSWEPVTVLVPKGGGELLGSVEGWGGLRPQPRNGDVSRESVPGSEWSQQRLGQQPPGAGAALPRASWGRTGSLATQLSPSHQAGLAIQSPQGPDPHVHHAPSVLHALKNHFYYHHYFSPHSDDVGTERERRGAELCSLPTGLASAPASLQGSNIPKISTFPGRPCLPVHPSGRREDFLTHTLRVLGWTCPLSFPSLPPSW